MIKGKHKRVEEALFLWHQFLRGNSLPVTGPILQEKALHFCRLLEGKDSDFTASNRWLGRFTKRFGIRQITISVEALSANKQAVPLFRNYLAKLIQEEEISREQLYNCDETGLNHKMLPTKTLAFASKEEASAVGYKMARNESQYWLAVMLLATINLG